MRRVQGSAHKKIIYRAETAFFLFTPDMIQVILVPIIPIVPASCLVLN